MVVRGDNGRSTDRRDSAALGSSSPADRRASAREIATAFAAEGARSSILDRLIDEATDGRRRRSADRAVECDLADADSTIGGHHRRRSTASAASTCWSTTPASSGSRRCSTSPPTSGTGSSPSTCAPMLLTTQVAARAMIDQGDGGKIVNMASMGGKLGAAGPGALRRVEGGRDLAHPGRGHRARRPRHHRQLDLPRLRAHRDGRRHPNARDGRRVVGEVAARPPAPTRPTSPPWPCSWRRATPTTAPARR